MQEHRLIKMGQYLDDTETPDPRTLIESLTPTRSILSHNKRTDSKNRKKDRNRSKSRSKENHPNRVYFKEEVQEIPKYERKASEDPNSDSESIQDQPTLNRLSSTANILTSNSKISLRTKKKTRHDLKEIISRQKVQILRDKFIDKIKRNNIFAPPVDFLGFDAGSSDQSFFNRQGFEINTLIDNGITLLSVIQITFLLLAYTLALVFTEIATAESVTSLQLFSLSFYLIEIGYHCATVKTASGKKLSTLSQILSNYWQTNMPIDIVSLLIIVIDVNSNFFAMKYVRLFILAKLPQCLDKIEKLQVFFIKNYYNEQYWSLIKVFLFNFCFAHILAILLTSISNIDPNYNWQTLKGIRNNWWFERYVWAYYWGTNIMLTVGFGDITASTYQQAICLVFIEMVSVICLAYNINWLGTLISNIRTQDREKSRNMKMFKQLSDKYELPEDLEWRINNYIEESVNIRKKFNLQEENAFISTLPPNLRKDYLQESNRSIFHDLTFFGNLVDRTLVSFAEKIEMLISHPEQTLRRIDDDYNLLILRQGQIGYVTKRRNCKYSDIMIMDRMKVLSHEKPSLLGLQFISRIRPNYEIKSTEYSVMYFMPFDQLISILKESQMDYLHYCYLRDRSKTTLDQFEVFVCQFCNSRHTKFSCPKLHFMPIQQHVIHRAQHKDSTSINQRNSDKDLRAHQSSLNPLKNFKKMNKIMKSFNKQKGGKLRAEIKVLDSFLQKSKFKSDPTLFEPAHDEMVEYFMKNTSEVIKQEFNRFSRTENYEDEVWIIHCDKMKNYKEYFEDQNASNLEENFKVETRMGKSRHDKKATNAILKSYRPANLRSQKLEPYSIKDMHSS